MTDPTQLAVIRGVLPTIVMHDPETGEPLSAPLRASMANVALIEDSFGSITEFSRAISPDTDRPMFGPVVRSLACLMPPGRFRDPDVLGEWLDAGEIGTYTAALGEVFAVAFPQAEPTPQDGPGNAPAVVPLPEQDRTPEQTGPLPPLPLSAYPPDASPLPPPWIQETSSRSPGDGSGTSPQSY